MKHANRGFSLAVVLMFGSLILFVSVLMLTMANINLSGKKTIAKRMRTESAAEQLSAAAQAALEAHVKTLANDTYFSLSADALTAPAITIASDTFTPIAQEYSDLTLSAETYDLYYADSFWETAKSLKLPQTAPYKNENGLVVRSYSQKVSAVPSDDMAAAEISKIIIAVRSTSGDVKFYVTSAVR